MGWTENFNEKTILRWSTKLFILHKVFFQLMDRSAQKLINNTFLREIISQNN